MANNIIVDSPNFNGGNWILETRATPDGKVIVKGILQRANHRNQNGRIYPKHILEREVTKYIKEFVQRNTALAELDHADCVSACNIWTYDGWKDIKTISDNEKIYTLNISNNNIELQTINKKINKSYNGVMYHIRGKNIDITATPNHRFLIKDRYQNNIFMTAREIYEMSNRISSGSHLSIPKVGNWIGNNLEEYIYLPAAEIKKGTKINRNKQKESLKLNTKKWFAFLGFYLAEGFVTKYGYGIKVCQNEGKKAEEFRNILTNLSSELNWTENLASNGKQIIFRCSDARLHSYLKVLGNKYTKYIPQEVKDASVPLLKEFFSWFQKGDGSKVNDRGYLRESVFTVSPKLITDLNEILIKIGKAGRIKTVTQKNRIMKDGRIIAAANCKPLYRLWIEKSKAIHLDFRFLEIDEINYNGNIYCVNVPNGTFYCENGGKQFWSGNSSIINLKNVSHNIKELHWDGDDLIGTIELLSTPCGNIAKELVKNGIPLGISSRGLGSTKQIDENTVEVGEDFSLLAFDLVCTPSTQGAYLSEGKTDVRLVLKETKVNNLIHDFFNEIG